MEQQRKPPDMTELQGHSADHISSLLVGIALRTLIAATQLTIRLAWLGGWKMAWDATEHGSICLLIEPV